MVLVGAPSISDLIIIFGVIFLLFGGRKLPELGGAIGEGIKNFKKGIKDDVGSANASSNRSATEAKPLVMEPESRP